jgi:hypothetical protein
MEEEYRKNPIRSSCNKKNRKEREKKGRVRKTCMSADSRR